MINNTNQIFLFFLLLLFTPSLFAQEVSPQPTAQQLLNPDWMEKQLKKVGIDQLVENYKGHEQKEIKLLHSALLLSQFVLREHPEALRSQLQGRLVSHPLPLLKPFQQLPKNQVQIYAMTGGVVQAGGTIVRTMTENGKPLLFGIGVRKTIFRKNKSQIITKSRLGVVKVIDIDQGKVLRTFQANRRTWRFELTSDEKTLITESKEVTPPGQSAPQGGPRNVISVWDVATGKLHYSLTFPKGHLSQYIISPDNTHLLVCIKGQPLTCWDIKTGKKIYSFSGKIDPRSRLSITFYPDGQRILIVNKNRLSIYNLQSGKHLSDVIPDIKIGGGIRYNSITTDNKYAIIIRHGGRYNQAFYELLNLKTGKNRIYLKGYFPPWAIRLLKFSVSKKKIIAKHAGAIKFEWDIETGKMLKSYPGLPANLEPVSISHDGKRMLTGRLGVVMKIADLSDSVTTSLPTGKDLRLFSILVSPDEKKIITGGSDKLIKQWDFQTMKLIRSSCKHSRIIIATNLSSDGKKIVASSFDHVIRLWDLEKGVLLKTFKNQSSNGMNHSVEIISNGKEIVSSMGGNYIAIWDLKTGEMKKVGEKLKRKRLWRETWSSEAVTKVILSPNRKLMISGGDDHLIKIWDRHSLKLLSTFKNDRSPICSLAIASDGKQLVSGTNTGKIYVRSFKVDQTGSIYSSITLSHQWHQGRICLLAFLPGNKLVLSGSKPDLQSNGAESSLRIWNSHTNKLLATFHLDSQIQSATLSSSGKYIVIGTHAGEIHKFRIDNLPK